MGIFDKSNYIVYHFGSTLKELFNNTSVNDIIGIIEQFFQCTTKVILLAKMIKLWTFYENVEMQTYQQSMTVLVEFVRVLYVLRYL